MGDPAANLDLATAANVKASALTCVTGYST